MKYLVMDSRKNDTFVNEFNNKVDAIKYAKDDFLRMAETDKKSCKGYIVLESVNPDEDSENHYDGNIIFY